MSLRQIQWSASDRWTKKKNGCTWESLFRLTIYFSEAFLLSIIFECFQSTSMYLRLRNPFHLNGDNVCSHRACWCCWWCPDGRHSFTTTVSHRELSMHLLRVLPALLSGVFVRVLCWTLECADGYGGLIWCRCLTWAFPLMTARGHSTMFVQGWTEIFLEARTERVLLSWCSHQPHRVRLLTCWPQNKSHFYSKVVRQMLYLGGIFIEWLDL